LRGKRVGRCLAASPQPFRFREKSAPTRITLALPVRGFLGVSPEPLIEMTDTVALLMVKDDAIVLERYASGYGTAVPSLFFSLAKSVLSILVDCAIADGYLHSTDQPEREILSLRLREPPGSRFAYKSGDAYLLALALARALGRKTLTDYAQERLWSPLGMEHDALWSIDHAPDGLEKAGCCLAATARDFAKLGRLYLNRGVWEGQRIVPEAWVAQSTHPREKDGRPVQYGYLWWPMGPARPDFVATGHLGQFLYVNPAENVVIVRLGRSMGALSADEWKELLVALSARIR